MGTEDPADLLAIPTLSAYWWYFSQPRNRPALGCERNQFRLQIQARAYRCRRPAWSINRLWRWNLFTVLYNPSRSPSTCFTVSMLKRFFITITRTDDLCSSILEVKKVKKIVNFQIVDCLFYITILARTGGSFHTSGRTGICTMRRMWVCAVY